MIAPGTESLNAPGTNVFHTTFSSAPLGFLPFSVTTAEQDCTHPHAWLRTAGVGCQDWRATEPSVRPRAMATT